MVIDLIDLSYCIDSNVSANKKKGLLGSVNLQIKSSEMCALMGPSGAGKSTLLDMIANRKSVGMWSGEILLNRNSRPLNFDKMIAYVMQDDVHIATLTVAETLRYAAWTRMPNNTSKANREQRVNDLLEMMGLTAIRDNIV
eukprot:gene13893-18630_t